jgi:hypothetical protein
MMNEKIRIYDAYQGAPLSRNFTLTLDDFDIPVYETCSRYGTEISFAYFDMDGSIPVNLTVEHLHGSSVESVRCLPQKYGITATQRGRKTEFTIVDPETYLTLIWNDDHKSRPLHIFANGPDNWGIDDARTVSKGSRESVVYFGPGYHEQPLGEPIRLKSDQTLYLAGGAWVNGSVLVERGSRNVHICGHGILAPDQISDNKIARGIQVDPGCSDIIIEGIITNKRVTGWCGILIHSRNIRIENYKVVTGCIWSTDGMNPVNSQNVFYKNCFIRCGDDTIAVKGFKKFGTRNLPEDDPADSPANENIQVESCILWSDNNNAIVLGQETKAAFYKNIHFRDCDILFTNDLSDRQGVLSLICLDGTNYSDISFEDIRVDHFQTTLITLFFTEEIFDIPGSQKWKGSMKNLIFRNITSRSEKNPLVSLRGWGPEKTIGPISLENIVINGETLKADSSLLKTNAFIHDLTIMSEEGEI